MRVSPRYLLGALAALAVVISVVLAVRLTDWRTLWNRAPRYQIAVAKGDLVRGGGRVEIRDAKGRRVRLVEGFLVSNVKEEDLTGDGMPELLIETYSGGAHCCFEAFVFSLGHRVENLLHFLGGSARLEKIENLDESPAKELISFDDSPAYFPGLSYASSPSLPIVLCLAGVNYVDCTERFPQLVEPEIVAARKALAEATSSEARRSAALRLLALHILLGREQEGWQVVEREGGSSVSEWLRSQRAELSARLQQRKKKVGRAGLKP